MVLKRFEKGPVRHHDKLVNVEPREYSRPDGSSRRSSQNVSSTSVLLLASPDLALPDSDVGPPNRGLSAGGTRVPRVLSDFHLLDAVRGENKASRKLVSALKAFVKKATYVFLKEAP
jgi:hypothetical protein